MKQLLRSCVQCHEGWTCEKHPGFPWPHPDEDDPEGECAGPGEPCPSGCLGIDSQGVPITNIDEKK